MFLLVFGKIFCTGSATILTSVQGGMGQNKHQKMMLTEKG